MPGFSAIMSISSYALLLTASCALGVPVGRIYPVGVIAIATIASAAAICCAHFTGTALERAVLTIAVSFALQGGYFAGAFSRAWSLWRVQECLSLAALLLKSCQRRLS